MYNKLFFKRVACALFLNILLIGNIHVEAKSFPNQSLKYKAIAFDGFPIFDPRPIFELTKKMYPEKKQLAKIWFNKIFAYSWIRTSGDQYVSFDLVVEQALDYSLNFHKISATTNEKRQLLGAWYKLKVWPDVLEALRKFKKNGIKMAFFSNLSEKMLRANARNSGIEDYFEYFVTDKVKAFKPSPRAYEMGVKMFKLSKKEVVFCAFGGWDAVGASWYGYPTVWVNRLSRLNENLDSGQITTGPDISTLVTFVFGTMY